MSDTITREDEGKPLVTPDGSVVGTVELVRGGTAFVRADPKLARSCPPWRDDPCERVLYALEDVAVDSVTNESITLRDEEPVSDTPVRVGSGR